MAETFPFRLVSPTGIIYEGPIEQATAVGALGEFGVLAEHVNFITSIEPGLITLKLADGSFIEYLLSGGIAEVKDGAMTVLATEALPLAAVDPAAAAPEVQQAEARLSQMSFYDPGYQEAEQALRNARARAEIAHLSRLAH
ncbi:MAG TPA: ATP synthase F1 subunit epsilon [Candidatus Binataceae bacterium]|nr:ATP synthase F1 subunit epsilon [Candidatus Binataceae bacterium]